MNNSRPSPISVLEHERDQYGVCQIHIIGKLAPDAMLAVTQSVEHLLAHEDLPVGIVLDIRTSPLLSAVRLASLIDVLSTLQRRLAVLVADERQRQIISLLHNTLERKDLIDYFTDLPTARAFILSGTTATGSPFVPPGSTLEQAL